MKQCAVPELFLQKILIEYTNFFPIFIVSFHFPIIHRKPKTGRGRRALEKREPKLVENSKKTLFFKGGNTSQTVTQILKEMVMFFFFSIFLFET